MAADKTGFHMLHALFQISLKFLSIKRFDEYYSTDLTVVDGRCRGTRAPILVTPRSVKFHSQQAEITQSDLGQTLMPMKHLAVPVRRWESKR